MGPFKPHQWWTCYSYYEEELTEVQSIQYSNPKILVHSCMWQSQVENEH